MRKDINELTLLPRKIAKEDKDINPVNFQENEAKGIPLTSEQLEQTDIRLGKKINEIARIINESKLAKIESGWGINLEYDQTSDTVRISRDIYQGDFLGIVNTDSVVKPEDVTYPLQTSYGTFKQSDLHSGNYFEVINSTYPQGATFTYMQFDKNEFRWLVNDMTIGTYVYAKDLESYKEFAQKQITDLRSELRIPELRYGLMAIDGVNSPVELSFDRIQVRATDKELLGKNIVEVVSEGEVMKMISDLSVGVKEILIMSDEKDIERVEDEEFMKQWVKDNTSIALEDWSRGESALVKYSKEVTYQSQQRLISLAEMFTFDGTDFIQTTFNGLELELILTIESQVKNREVLVDQKIDEINNRIQQAEQSLLESFKEMKDDFSGQFTSLEDDINTKINDIVSDAETSFQNFTNTYSQTINRLENQKVNLSMYLARIELVNREFDSMHVRISEIENDYNELDSAVDNIEGWRIQTSPKITDHENRITSNTDKISELDKAVDVLESFDIDNKLRDIDSKATGANTRITNLVDQVINPLSETSFTNNERIDALEAESITHVKREELTGISVGIVFDAPITAVINDTNKTLTYAYTSGIDLDGLAVLNLNAFAHGTVADFIFRNNANPQVETIIRDTFADGHPSNHADLIPNKVLTINSTDTDITINASTLNATEWASLKNGAWKLYSAAQVKGGNAQVVTVPQSVLDSIVANTTKINKEITDRQADTLGIRTSVSDSITAIEVQLDGKADKATTYTKTEVDGKVQAAIDAIPDVDFGPYSTTTEMNVAINNAVAAESTARTNADNLKLDKDFGNLDETVLETKLKAIGFATADSFVINDDKLSALEGHPTGTTGGTQP